MTLEEKVREAWTNAVENGYVEFLMGDAEAVAVDMCDCDSDLEDENPQEIAEIVRKIQKEN